MNDTVPAPRTVTARQAWAIYFPLAASWLFMAVEAPVSNFILSRHPDPTLTTASYMPLMAMCMLIESPVIDLLTTSTTLGAKKSAFPVLKQYAGLLCLLVTLVHALVVFTPLYDILTLGALKLEPEIARTAHVPMMIMTPWAGFVGQRRYLQGLMIRNGETKRIGFGTFLRMATVVVCGAGLTLLTKLPGLVVVAWGLVASVAVEAGYIRWASRRVVATYTDAPDDGVDAPTLSSVLHFHLPLFGTMLIIMSMSLVVTAALSRGMDAVVSLAAWQLAASTVWLFRTVLFALPEMIISQFEGGHNAAMLFKFSTTVGLVCSGVMLIAVVTGLDRFIFRVGFDAEATVAASASLAFALCVALPIVSAWISYVRAALTAKHDTASRFWAIIVDVAVLFAMLEVGVRLRWPGVVNASVALTLALAVETAFLASRWQRLKAREAMNAALAAADV
ncbi:MAG: hypothetical protein KF857_02385 [Fimbriimonadaceae bacterium]|nr:hypothetical protein [Fimbriimonadaceae bacterium]